MRAFTELMEVKDQVEVLQGELEAMRAQVEMENGKLEAEIVKLGAMHMQELGQY